MNIKRTKWWLGLMMAICAWSPSWVWAKDVRPRAVGVVPSAPTASDTCFVVHSVDPTSGNLGRYEEKVIQFQIPIGRYFGRRDLLLANEALPKKVTLSLAALDVDDAQGEIDEVFVNNHPVGRLRGANNKWRVNKHFDVPISIIKLPSAPQETALNEITIKIAVGNPNEGWYTRVEWAALEIPAPPPVVISHGIMDSAEGNLALRNAVSSLGLPVYLKSYRNDGLNSIQDGAAQLAGWVEDMCQKCRVDKVTILCHSMGGIKAREYTTEFDKSRTKVDRVIQIGTPNGGAHLAYIPDVFAAPTMPLLPAFLQLPPAYMQIYNKSHHLNPAVNYMVLAGDCGVLIDDVTEWWERMLLYGYVKQGVYELFTFKTHDWLYSNYWTDGDGIVSVKSAHTMVPKHPKSPVKDRRAWHGGLVLGEQDGGMVETIIGKKLKGDLLACRDTCAFSRGRNARTSRQMPPKKEFEAEDESEEDWPCAAIVGEVEAGNKEFYINFNVVADSNQVVAVNISSFELLEIESVISPSGIQYIDNGNRVFSFSNPDGTFVLLAAPEVGTWAIKVRRKGEWQSVALQYGVQVRESDLAFHLKGGLREERVMLGTCLELEMTAATTSDVLCGLEGTATLILPDGTQEETILEEIGGGSYRASIETTQPGMYLISLKLRIGGVEYSRVCTATVYSGGAEFDTFSTDGPRDDDDDGLFDRLSVSGTLSGVRSDTAYRIFAELSDQNGEEITWATANVSGGATTFRLDFDGNAIYEFGAAARYVVSNLRLSEQGDTYEAEIDARDGEVVFEGMDWSWQDFAHSHVTIPGTGTDVTSATNAASTLKSLLADVNVEYDSLAAGTYDYSVSLKTSNGALIGTSHGTVELPPCDGQGTANLHLEFDGLDIADSRTDGPYFITDLLLWNDSNDFTGSGTYETHAWTAGDFMGGNYVDPDTGLTWIYGVFDNAATLWGVDSASGALDIPSELGGYPVTTISTAAFSGCGDLVAVNLPDGVTNIGSRAFSGCTGVTSLTIPDSVAGIGSFAFEGCSNLWETTTIPDVQVVDGWIVGCESSLAGDLDLTGVRGIADEAFSECTGLASVTVSDSLTEIGYGAFAGCTNLTLTVTCPTAHTYSPFFRGCNQLTHVALGAGTTRVPAFCFSGLDSLQSVELPNSVTNIGEYAFANCIGLEGMAIPKFVTSIGMAAFQNCVGLTAVAIPQRLTRIGNNAFENCTALQDVHISSLADWCAVDFSNASANPLCNGGKLYLNDELLSALVIPDGVARIKSCAFYGASKLTSVTIGPDVTSVGSSAFAHCEELELVTIGDRVATIGDYAFSHCSPLKVTLIGNGVTNVGNSVFAHSSSLNASTLYVPASWEGTTMLANANVPARCKVVYGTVGFETVDGLNWGFVVQDGATMLAAGNYSGDVSIPSQLGGCTVTSLGDYAFYKRADVTSVVLSDCITNVGMYAFFNCGNLLTVTIPDSVTSIGSQAFSGCRGLATMTIPESVVNIGGGAFRNCVGLETLYVPGTWKGTSMLASADVPAGCHVIYGTGESEPDEPAEVEWLFEIMDGTVMITGANPATGSLVIPSELQGYPVTGIGDNAFNSCSELVSVAVPVGVTNLGNYAFAYCPDLQVVTLPSSLTSIGMGVFSGCDALLSVTIPDSVTRIGDYAFSYCGGLTNAMIPDSVTSMGEGVFSACHSLKSATIGDGVLHIPNETFYGCNELASMALGANVVNVGRSAFLNCNKLPMLTIPDSVTNIGSAAFYGCAGLASVVLPSSLVNIEDNAFSGCRGLTEVTIPNSVTRIGNSTFSGCSGVTNATIGNNVRNIGTSAFFSCSGLATISIPSSVTNIGYSAFRGCSSLAEILVAAGNQSYVGENGVLCSKDKRILIAFPGGKAGGYLLPEGVASIEKYAFAGSPNLASVTVSTSVTNIGYGAFYGCIGLTSVTIPDNATTIGGYAFYGCSSLAMLYVPASWEGTTKLANAQVPAGCTVVYGVPEAGATSTPVPVPHSWLEENVPELLTGNGNDYEAAALTLAPNGRTVWECYLTGAAPIVGGRDFDIIFRIGDNGEWLVGWQPDLNDGEAQPIRAYRIEAKQEMSDDEWTDVTEEPDLASSGWNFFRIRVSLPE